MFAHEFMRNALIAGSFVGLASGLVGYFVVLRAQVLCQRDRSDMTLYRRGHSAQKPTKS